ncbi:hypothetical protein [Pelosinus baikalensis]|uniref:Uncharacterized protein n=1 Tax=Pelosinus baikalensis TaxID=2892015 RepID=A0ABS8HWW5_9FIRM|nr:hypothetical protein [Pelosinus baikalensis]MCC5467656.1 hypothetical protein [Pelosinus baikalensis]
MDELQPRAKRIWPSGKHYKKALPQESWSRAERFIKIMANARSYAATLDMQPEIDLKKLRESFSFIEKEMAQ